MSDKLHQEIEALATRIVSLERELFRQKDQARTDVWRLENRLEKVEGEVSRLERNSKY